MSTRLRHRLREEDGNLLWSLVILIFALVLITAFTAAVISNVKRTGATNSDIAITQRTDAAIADAIAHLSDGKSVPATRATATTECQDVDNRYVCYSYWAMPRPGNAKDALRYDLITQTWDDSRDRDGLPPTDHQHLRTVRVPLEAITYQGEPISDNGRIVYDATPSGLFANAMFSFRETTINGPDVNVRSYNSTAAVSGTDNGTVASGGWVSYGRAVDVNATRLYGTDSPGTDRTTRCTGEPCEESDVVAMNHTYKLADAASVAWMRNGTANPSVACQTTIEGSWVASEQGASIDDTVLCINGNLVIDTPTTLSVPTATVVVHGNVVIESSLNAPGSSYAWASPSRLAIYSTGQAVTFDPSEPADPGTAVAALLYAPRAVCSTDPANQTSRDAADHTGSMVYSGSLVCDTISLGGSWTHAYDDAIAVNFVDPVRSSSKAWVIGAPDVVNPDDWEVPVGWENPTCVPPLPIDAAGWWRLTEPSGSVAKDSAGNHDLGWLTSERGEGICASAQGVASKGAALSAGETAATDRTIVSAVDGVALEWWGKDAVGTLTSAGVTVTGDNQRHLSVTAGGTTARFPFTVENHDKWHLYTVTVSPTGQAKLYIDAKHKMTVTVGSPAEGGRTAVGPGTKGSISELVTYSRVLSVSDIEQRWAAWNTSIYFEATDPGTPFTAPVLSDNGTVYKHLKVKWTPAGGTFPTGDLTTYRVQSAPTQNGTYTQHASLATPTSSWASTDPPSGERWYRVCAVYNGDTQCGPSVKIVAIPPLVAPTVSVGTVTTSNARFTWTEVPYAAKYQRQVRVNGGSWSTAANTTTRAVDHGGNQGTRLEVRVRAVDEYGNTGPWSSIASALLGMDRATVDRWATGSSYPTMTSYLMVDSGRMCATGVLPETRMRSKRSDSSSWSSWSAWTRGVSNKTTTNTSTLSSYTLSLTHEVQLRCVNTASEAVSSTTTHSVTMQHTMPKPSGVWAKTTDWRVAGWGATCPSGTSAQYTWKVTAAWGTAQQTTFKSTPTTYSRTGDAWGSGRIDVTARCAAGSRYGATATATGTF